ncbi:hypothetical protein SAMN05518672_10786 [Chitinophaga sp. CF118]|uniref:hypothetical protein n=1 Tax=Chitinophaga sp. CF118 TaxID=1884367 RepID=UPI0008E2720D|nr:hypothetical protein [Chitinophaga sp. CF118]SFE52313.1 hypothetical protein SAMN05518672_10786 [Chitinophaga sp. CF118]
MKYFWPAACLFVLFSTHIFAQLPKVQLSQTFPEPGEGFEKILLLDNGNTCYLHFDKKLGIQITLYNQQREVSANETVTGKLWDAGNINDTEIDGIYNINGQVVIFLQQLVKYKPCMFRLVLDGKNGQLVREDKLGELPTVLHRDVFVQNNFASHDFYTAKDPHSGYYALASFAGGELQRNENSKERIQVSLFSPEHQLIQQTAYYLPEETFSYFSFLDMTVQGKERVYIATAALSNRKSSKDTASCVLISEIKTGDNTFTHQLLPYTANFSDLHASIRYVPATQRLQLLLTTMIKNGKLTGLATYMNYLDAGTLQLLHMQPVTTDKISAYAQEKMKYTTAYSGQPQLLLPDTDGSATVLLENMSEFASGNSPNAWNRMHTNMNDIGISHLDTAGVEQSGYALPKMQVANGIYEPLYLQRKQKGQWIFRNRIQALNTTPYLSFEYLPTPHGTYILFNDYLQYLDPGGTYQDKKPMRYLTEANIVCYRCNDSTQERLFLFGTPETFKGYYCMLGASDYQSEKGIYATLMITRKGEEKKACVAWVEF